MSAPPWTASGSELAGTALEHDVYFGPVLVAEVEEADGRLVPARMPAELLMDEGFKELPQGVAVGR